jgi:hypothetical protein
MRSAPAVTLLALSLLCACGPRGPEPVAPTIIEEDEKTTEPEKDHKIKRSAYERVLKEGLPKVMQWYWLEAHKNRGRFVGFKIKEIYREDVKGGPIRVKDVLLSINDLPIERPEHAQSIWRGLWSKRELKIELLRDGKRMIYTIPIIADE